MPLDASVVRAVVFETDKRLSGGRIEKIYQPERDEAVLSVRTKEGAQRLVISANGANPRIYITDSVKENPAEPPMFCMLMRKHLSGGRIIKISQPGFERIADIECECRNEMGDTVNKHIICEIMGRNSNIILTNGDGKIIDAIRHVDLSVSRVRNVFPGLGYTLPPDSERKDPLQMDEEDFFDAISRSQSGKALEKALPALICGISPLVVREALFRAKVTGEVSAEMNNEEKRRAAKVLYDIFQKVKEGEFSPTLIYRGGGSPTDFAAIDITQYGASCERDVSMCSVMEKFYKERDMAERMRSRAYSLLKTVNAHLDRIRKKIPLLYQTLKDAEDREKYKIAGDTIMANLHTMKTGDEFLTAVNYYDIEQKDITIALDRAKSPSQNAQSYYKKYAKAKTAEVTVKKQIELAKREEEYLESVLSEIERATAPSELSEIRSELIGSGLIRPESKKEKKKPSQSLPEEYFFEGYTIYSGKNNLQNDYLTMKMGRANDLWLHTKLIPGSHVVVKYMGEEYPEKVIEAAAVIAATNSKGAGAPRVDVDYCPVSHVKKPNGAKAGMVVYEGYNTASVAPDKSFCEKLAVKK